MKDVIKLKQTEFGFVEDENGVEYIRYSFVASMQKSVIDENKKLRARINKLKTKNNDQHPREGLWDAEKVCKYLEEHAGHYMTLENDEEGELQAVYYPKHLVEDLRKAMEKS